MEVAQAVTRTSGNKILLTHPARKAGFFVENNLKIIIDFQRGPIHTLFVMTIEVTWTGRDGTLHVKQFPSRPSAHTYLRNIHTEARKRRNAPGASATDTADYSIEAEAITKALVSAPVC